MLCLHVIQRERVCPIPVGILITWEVLSNLGGELLWIHSTRPMDHVPQLRWANLAQSYQLSNLQPISAPFQLISHKLIAIKVFTWYLCTKKTYPSTYTPFQGYRTLITIFPRSQNPQGGSRGRRRGRLPGHVTVSGNLRHLGYIP
jgi:hypothetical protein